MRHGCGPCRTAHRNTVTTMRMLVFVPPRNFRDESLSAIRLFFDRWDIQYSITSYSTGECVGYHGAVCKPDLHANKVSISDYDGIILLDGKGVDEYKLYDYRPLLDTLLQFNNRGKIIGAINNSVKILARANIIKDKKLAAPADDETRRLVLLFHGALTERHMEVSGNIITINGAAGLDGPLQELAEHLSDTR